MAGAPRGIAATAFAAACAAVLALAGCSWFDPRDDDPTVAYAAAEDRALLEVPPDVSGELHAGLLRIPAEGKAPISRATLLPEPESVRLVRDGRVRWLELTIDARELWPALKDFWRQQGYAIVRDEPLLGVMETGWRDQREAVDGGEGGGMLATLFAGAYSDSRVKYRTRLERIADDEHRIRLFLSQRLTEEEVVGAAGGRKMGDRVYLRRAGDTEREQEMLARLLVYLGIREQRARGILSEAEIEQLAAPVYLEDVDGRPTLVVADAFQRVWRRAAEAIEAIGLDIEKTVPMEARYEVLFSGELPASDTSATRKRREQGAEQGEGEGSGGGFFGRLLGGSDDVEQYYQLYVLEEPGRTRITIADVTGTSKLPELEREIMRRLREALR